MTLTLFRVGVGNFLRPWAVLNFFGPLGHTIKNQGLQVTLLQQIWVHIASRCNPRAEQNVLAGRIWPAGRTFFFILHVSSSIQQSWHMLRAL